MNHYTNVTAQEVIPGVQVNDCDELAEKLEGTGLDAELWNCQGKGKNEKGDLYIFGEAGHFDEELFIESGAVECIGRILKKSKKSYLELGMAFYGDKARPNTCDGTAIRITADGDLVWAERVWPSKKKPKKQKVWVIQVHCRDGADDFVTVDGAFSTAAKAKARMKQYSNRKRSEETGETYYSPDEMKLVCLELE